MHTTVANASVRFVISLAGSLKDIRREWAINLLLSSYRSRWSNRSGTQENSRRTTLPNGSNVLATVSTWWNQTWPQDNNSLAGSRTLTSACTSGRKDYERSGQTPLLNVSTLDKLSRSWSSRQQRRNTRRRLIPISDEQVTSAKADSDIRRRFQETND